MVGMTIIADVVGGVGTAAANMPSILVLKSAKLSTGGPASPKSGYKVSKAASTRA